MRYEVLKELDHFLLLANRHIGVSCIRLLSKTFHHARLYLTTFHNYIRPSKSESWNLSGYVLDYFCAYQLFSHKVFLVEPQGRNLLGTWCLAVSQRFWCTRNSDLLFGWSIQQTIWIGGQPFGLCAIAEESHRCLSSQNCPEHCWKVWFDKRGVSLFFFFCHLL